MTNLRYAQYPSLSDPNMSWAIWEYPRIPEFSISSATIVQHRINGEGIDFGNHQPFDDFLISSNIPVDWDLIRGLTTQATSAGMGSPIFYSSDILYNNIFLPTTYEPLTVTDHILKSITKSLRKYDLPCFNEGNDIFYRHNGLTRKVTGGLYQNWGNGWASYNLFITFDLDTTTIDSVIDFTKPYWVDRGITSITDRVGLLFDINPSLNINQIANQVLQDLAERYNLTLVEEVLTSSEITRLQTLASGLSTDDWLYNLIHPDLGQQ